MAHLLFPFVTVGLVGYLIYLLAVKCRPETIKNIPEIEETFVKVNSVTHKKLVSTIQKEIQL